MRLIKAKELLSWKKPFVPIDATWYLPNSPHNGHKQYLEARIPGARYFDVDGVKETNSPYPHMMPSKTQFEGFMSQLGITSSDTLVIYDKQSYFSAPRAAWMFETFKHPDAYLLENWQDYVALGGAIESGEPSKTETSDYKAHGEDKWVSFDEMKDLVLTEKIRQGEIVLLDARPHGRFTGEASEPRPEIPSGHISGAFSVPFTEVLQDGYLKSPEAIKELLASKNVPTNKPTIVMCGTGVTACVTKSGVDQVLEKPALVYDGSWTEWAQRAPDLIERSA